MNMKNIIYILLGFVVLVLASCSEDKMDEINANPNNPTEVNSNLIITDVIVNSAFAVTSSDLAFYASSYIEHQVGVYNQMYNAEIRTTGPVTATTYNNSWNAMYNNLYNLKDIIAKCSEGGSEEGNYHTLGIAQILSAYNLAILTDVMGDVPWTDALQPGVVYKPNLDKQEVVYTDVFAFLDAAIENLGKETNYPALDVQDPIYGGDEAMWLKAAHGLYARYKMRLHTRSSDLAGVISHANQSFASVAEELKYDYSAKGGSSPFYQFFVDRDYYGASQSLHDKLIALNDPRDSIFWKPYPDSGDEILFALNGDPNRDQQAQGVFSVSALSHIGAPTFMLSYHEVQFLLAEAYARDSQLNEAKAALENALGAAFGKLAYAINDRIPGNSASTLADNYFTNFVEARFDTDPVREVMLQKYIAFYEEEAVEAYNDIRRLNAMGGDNATYITFAHPEPDKFPLRYTYGNSDVTTNENVRVAYEAIDVFNDNVWWAGGDK